MGLATARRSTMRMGSPSPARRAANSTTSHTAPRHPPPSQRQRQPPPPPSYGSKKLHQSTVGQLLGRKAEKSLKLGGDSHRYRDLSYDHRSIMQPYRCSRWKQLDAAWSQLASVRPLARTAARTHPPRPFVHTRRPAVYFCAGERYLPRWHSAPL